MRVTLLVAGLLTLAILGACAPPAPQEAAPTAAEAPGDTDPVDEVLAFRDEHVTALIDWRDMERILSHYVEDATFAPPSGEAVVGREAIGRYLEEFFSRSLFGVRFENRSVLVDGDLAVIRDGYNVVLIPRSGSQTQHAGEDVWVLRRVDGNWRVASVMWTEGDDAVSP